MPPEITERLAKLEADERNIFHQLSEIKEEVKDIRRLTNAVEKIAQKTESIETKVVEMGKRVSEVENEPLEEYKNFKRLVLGAVVTTALSTVVTAILALIMRA
jgi:methylthioribose-1-phosphate isomerase